MIKSKLYQQYITENSSTLTTSESIEELNKKNEESWNGFIKNIISEYEGSPEYKQLLRELNMCEELSGKEVTEIKEIKRATKKYNVNDK